MNFRMTFAVYELFHYEHTDGIASYTSEMKDAQHVLHIPRKILGLKI